MSLPIRLRLAVVGAALIATLVGAFGAFVYFRLEADLVGAVDDSLAERAQALIDEPPAGPDIPEGASDIGDVFAAILGPDRRVVSSTADFPETALVDPAELADLGTPRTFERTIPSDEDPTAVRLLVTPGGDGTMVLTGVAFDDQRATLAALRDEVLVGLPIAALLALALGWFVAGAALRPVERMRSEAEAISETDLTRRLADPRTRDELAALGRSLNRMLERLEMAVERERRLVDDASHELRTPLANLKGELELALSRARTEPELVAAVQSALEETDRLTRLAADLLVLARAQRGLLPVRPRDVDIGALVTASIDGLARQAASAGVALEAVVEPGLRARLDPDRLRQALDNLVDNAIRQTPRGGTVTIDAGVRDGTLRLAVADTGRGFPVEFLAEAFEPFRRLDAGRSRTDGGTGLGLTIVRAVAEAHRGSVAAANRDTGGAIVELLIPS
jgi:two-component system OmpR family sensor kinase